MRHLISLKEQSKEDILEILDIAIKLKKDRSNNIFKNYLQNKTLLMLFQKSSTRTRLSFEAGMTELGGHAIFIDQKTTQFSLTDFGDEIQAVMRFGQIMMMRAQKAESVIKAASYNKIPIIDACSEKYHPCQALGDLLTMIEHSNGLENIKKISWLGIENNVSNTLKLVCSKLGIEVSIISPKVHEISIDEELNKQANETGFVKYTLNIEDGLKNTNYVHTDTWMDMEFFENGKIKEGFENEFDNRKKLFTLYQLNSELIEKYCPNAKIMHCMPCHIGYEITSDAIHHKNSIIFDQAENRMHIQKAIMLWLLDVKL